MRLNGITAPLDTIIGLHYRELRFLAVSDVDDKGVSLRFATGEEVEPKEFMQEPGSVVEHRAIPCILTPFGMGRVYKPVPYPRTGGTDPMIGRYRGRPRGILDVRP